LSQELFLLLVKDDNLMKQLFNEKNTIILGMICALIGGSAYGASQFMFKQVFEQDIAPLVAVSYALLTGAVVLTLINIKSLKRSGKKIPKEAYIYCIISGICASGGLGFSALALNIAPVVVVSPIFALVPLVTLSLTVIFLKSSDKVTKKIWLGATLVVIGVILIGMGAYQ
jgi:drug/metabolite transporter (DMT)-like permease